MYIGSSNIKVFPSQRRDQSKDRESLLFTEFNVVNMINRLTDIKSFVVDEKVIENINYGTIGSGGVNIGGYYFKIENPIHNIPTGSTTENQLIFEISMATVNTPYGAELDGEDEDNNYKGLNLVSTSNKTNNSTTLILADWVNGSWQPHMNSLLKYDSKTSIKVKGEDLKGTASEPTYTLLDGSKEYNLIEALKNIVIDDGEL